MPSKLFAVVFVLVLICCRIGCGQTVTIRSGNSSAMAFNTKLGLCTVDHAEWFLPSVRFAELDMRLGAKLVDVPVYSFGLGEPKYFIDRRGSRHELTRPTSSRYEYEVAEEFFSGESGLPVFNSEGKVVGLVLGNVIRSEIRGRIAKCYLAKPVHDLLSDRARGFSPGSDDP